MGKEQDLLQAVKDQDVGSVEKFLVKYRSTKKIVGSTKKFNINQQSAADGLSVLHHASLLGSVEILKLLLDHGALVDLEDAKGLRPLHYAAWQGHTRPTEILLHQRSSVDKPSFDGNSPLHLACEHGHFDVVKRLLEYGADICMANSQRKMPLDLACEFGRTSVVEKLLESESARSALQDTSNDTADNNSTTCLHLAARNGHIDTIRLLLEAGIDINRTTLQGTCLHEAAKYGKSDVVRLLLSCGIDVSRLNSYEQTALELVNKFTMTRAARELKQMLKEASSELRIQPICDRIPGSDSHSPNVFKEGGFQLADQSKATAGMWKGHQNGLDGCSAGHAVFFPPNTRRAVDSTPHKKKFGNSSHPNRSSPQPIEVPHFGGNIGVEGGGRVPSPQLPLGKIKASSHELGANSGLLAHLLAHRSAEFKIGSSGDIQSPILLGSSQSLRNGSRSSTSDDGNGKDGSNRMSGGSSGNGSCHSGGSQQSDGCQNHLSGQSYESGSSDVSSSRHSSHSSGSSQGSLDHLEESGYSSTVNVHELLQQGLSDTDILHTWLSSLHLEDLTSMFVNAGYDMPTITRMTPEDLTAIGITRPSMRKKLKSEIFKLSISDGIPDYRPKDLSDWLRSLRLDEYRETLVKQGFGTLDTVTEITWEDLEEIGIKKLGHQKKIMLAIDRLKRINTILHRLSGSSHSSNEGLNHYDSLVPGGKLLSRISSTMSSTSPSSSPSFVSTSSQHHHAAACENSMLWKTNTRKNGSILCERIAAGSVEMNPVPINKFSTNFPLLNTASVDHSSYPALLESCSKNDPANQMLGDATDYVGSNGGLDGDATPTNERKLLGNNDGNKGFTRANYSQEEPVDFYKADQPNMKPNVLSSYSTLPKKICGKRKVTDLDHSSGLGFSGFLNFENVLSSKKTYCNPSLLVEQAGLQPALSNQKKEPPPPPKRSDSFKTSALALGNRERLRMQSQNSPRVLSNISSETSEDLASVLMSNRRDAENNEVANGDAALPDANGAAKSSSAEFLCGAQRQTDRQTHRQTSSKTVNEHENLQGDNWQDGRLGDDSNSGLESRHSASSASLESSGSGGGIESNTLPFANENVGTIKQRNPSSKPSILNGIGNELDKSLFENESSQFTLVNGEIISKPIINNGNLPFGANADEVFDDIDGMLNGLTQELDEMLKLHG